MILDLLTTLITDAILKYLKGTTSIMMHGSGARGEATLYSDGKYDMLLGNLGFTVLTKSLIRDGLSYFLLSRFLRNLNKTYLSKLLDKPLVLVKPFEISLIPRRWLLNGHYPSDIWVFEMVRAGKIIYGDNLLPLFNINFNSDSGFRMIINRLFGLNLCLPLIARLNFDHEIKVLAVNYESVKGILAALESLLVLLGKYRPSYSERGFLASEVVNTYRESFDNPNDTIKTFKYATELKLNPQKLSQLSPVSYWFKSRAFLRTCLRIYIDHGISFQDVYSKAHRTVYLLRSSLSKIKESYEFIANGKINPRLVSINNLEKTATNLMLSCVFSLNPELCGKPSKYIEDLVSASRYANFLHTRGEWHEITDHIKCIQPVQGRRLKTTINIPNAS